MTSNPVINLTLDVRPVQTARAFEEIALQLRNLISSGKLRPGDRLPSERELAVLFNVSRNTLREALRSLEISGMIELRKGIKGGAFVRPGDPSVVVGGFLDLYHLGAITPTQLTESRIWIEDLVVRVACRHATEDDLLQLETNIDATERAMKTQDMNAWTDELLTFHSLLGRATHNPVMMIVMEAIIKITRQFIDAIGPQLTRTVVPSRRRLVSHLRARDEAAAGREMTEHLERLHRQYLTQLKRVAKETTDLN
ncbi:MULTISPECIES: FadR/GntR family transcriptional regulator [Burkholderia]|uniref:Pyruvate dehydrogenase complex repressor n=1 Tax=Burkholderia pseudomultivorans TaxID=1207504 RepID=A0ABU2EC71_9BURK|nr:MULTISPECIES: FadR/GntR family transcriptional regulator [Burkholderia]MDR8731480.1 Pyruvate dehydrogenase complex repressor [Burkholderia pseudomultivorans]MDR8738756.1 Pyruvate dehydrogenase complex repressor [Burkholderia pseudomultivorans]MDR8745411.1 Pyruvate dehydrogenase complex repressor [Burkholderia pseudomultivorans]MDR8757495.1 Pyruvate dehydrogenase complex repressor [Burkholderia pseudomultivorans]MDR8821372.1 Pyruvate dehydrogenase complex repressor [Burkholderia pseudomultiv